MNALNLSAVLAGHTLGRYDQISASLLSNSSTVHDHASEFEAAETAVCE